MVDVLNPTAWSETDASNGSGTQPSWPENMPGANVNNAARAMQGALKRFANQINATKTMAGGPTAYTVAYTVAPEALYDRQRFAIIANIANAATPNLNINSLGAKTIKKVLAGVVTDLVANEFGANAILDLVYISALNAFIWLNPSVSSASVSDASTTVKGIIEIATRAETQAGTSALLALTPDTIGSLLYKGSNIAGGTSISLADGGFFEITGTGWSATSIVYTVTSALGRRALLKFVSAGGILVHGANLILPTAANITVAADDIAEIVLESSGVYRVVAYLRASGAALVSTTYAPLASPVFTGNPTGPTPTPGDNDVSLATTAFVTAAIAAIGAAGAGVAKAWGRYQQTGTHTLIDSFGVASIADAGVGDSTITLSAAMAGGTGYVVVCSNTVGSASVIISSSTQFSITNRNSAGTPADATGYFAVFGD